MLYEKPETIEQLTITYVYPGGLTCRETVDKDHFNETVLPSYLKGEIVDLRINYVTES